MRGAGSRSVGTMKENDLSVGSVSSQVSGFCAKSDSPAGRSESNVKANTVEICVEAPVAAWGWCAFCTETAHKRFT